MARARSIKNPLLTIFPSPLLHLLSSSSPRKSHQFCINHLATLVLLWVVTLLAAYVLVFFPAGLIDTVPCLQCVSPSPLRTVPRTLLASLLPSEVGYDQGRMMDKAVLVPLPVQGVAGDASEAERELWEHLGGGGYTPCLEFSLDYRKRSNVISKEKRRSLVIVASGGLN